MLRAPLADSLVVALLILSFALGVTTHVSIACGLARRAARGRALLALLAPPIAPLLALRARLFGRAALWCAAFGLHLLARALP